ncbi:hypothetical protein L332_03465 [Agrococcus pavilionensis RW1]|uniref:HNH endonuclease n=1 Tax=Agrococcus pavilionensis RW1 TaxID=1330458 RepID=U1LME9_9MICO|nr:hypothetical protein [Agrococcus pavilionensis]ERG63514.1 hypothetical protein L332_03465 [Agrococcus pavilionensis RW1]
MSDVTPKWLLRALDERDGHVCAWHGAEARSDVCRPGTLVPQHRDGGMGGSAVKHRLSNVVWLDSLTNGLIEADPTMQAEAYRRGVKLRGDVVTEEEPIEHAVHGRCFLLDDGSVVSAGEVGW